MRRAAAQAAISGLTGPDFFKMRQIWRSESPCRTASTDTSAGNLVETQTLIKRNSVRG